MRTLRNLALQAKASIHRRAAPWASMEYLDITRMPLTSHSFVGICNHDIGISN